MKKEEDDLLVYDEDEAVKYIYDHLPADAKENIDDTKIEYILDVIYDYYDEKGLVDEDTAEEASIDEEEMLHFIMKCIKKDKMELNEEEVELILDGEYNYGVSIGIYNE